VNPETLLLQGAQQQLLRQTCHWGRSCRAWPVLARGCSTT
jgi:hypothetical protein